MAAMKEAGKLNHTVVFMQTLLLPLAYVGIGKGTALMTAPFQVSEGVHQGTVESGWIFSLGVKKPFQRCNRTLTEQGGGMTAIINDNYTVGPPEIAFAANRTLAEELKEVGLKMKNSKSKCHIGLAFRHDT